MLGVYGNVRREVLLFEKERKKSIKTECTYIKAENSYMKSINSLIKGLL